MRQDRKSSFGVFEFRLLGVMLLALLGAASGVLGIVVGRIDSL